MQKNDRKLHFFSKIFGHIKKKQYLCTRFRKESATYRIGAVVQLVRIHACHAWGRGFESRPHRKKEMQSASLFCGIRTARNREYAQRRSRVRVPSAPQEAIREGCFFFVLLVLLVLLVRLVLLDILAQRPPLDTPKAASDCSLWCIYAVGALRRSLNSSGYAAFSKH